MPDPLKTLMPSEGHAESRATKYGFTFGAATVTRLAARESGTVVLGITAQSRPEMLITVTPSGRMRVFVDGVEWRAQEGAR